MRYPDFPESDTAYQISSHAFAAAVGAYKSGADIAAGTAVAAPFGICAVAARPPLKIYLVKRIAVFHI
jgi:hypothetical protein